MLTVPITQLDSELPVPSYARTDDAGADLYAREGAVLRAGAAGRSYRPPGVAILPAGRLRPPRSGLALRHGVSCLNTPGPSTPATAASCRSCW